MGSGGARRPVLGVIGQGTEPAPALKARAEALGQAAVDAGFRLASGGLAGVMEAASRGAHRSDSYREGDVIGVIPTYDTSTANRWVDVVVPSGLSMARNIVLVAMSDVVVAMAGGAGTLSELAAAWQLGKPVVALGGEGWAGRLAGQAIDARRSDTIVAADTPEAAVQAALEALRRERPRS